MRVEKINWQQAAQRLQQGEAGVLPTDTMYGIVGSAFKPAVVERIYALRQRELSKPMIILVADWSDLGRLQIEISDRTQNLLKKVWPGPVSVVVPAGGPEWAYLHRGTNSLAVRMPAKVALRRLLEQTGPLVAPSANLAGEEPAATVQDAYGYFGDEVFYLDEGRLNRPASALLDARTDPPKVLRPAPGFAVEDLA